MYVKTCYDFKCIFMHAMRYLTTSFLAASSKHDDVIKWNHFPRYWAFVRESPVTAGFPSQRLVTRSFEVFFDLHLNKRLCNRDTSDLRRPSAHYDVTVLNLYPLNHIPQNNKIHSFITQNQFSHGYLSKQTIQLFILFEMMSKLWYPP